MTNLPTPAQAAQQQVSPLPWTHYTVTGPDFYGCTDILSTPQGALGYSPLDKDAPGKGYTRYRPADAAFIVRAVNAHQAMVDALTELVACKEIKAQYEVLDGYRSKEHMERWQALRSEYDRRQPLAWAAARSALSSISAAKGGAR